MTFGSCSRNLRSFGIEPWLLPSLLPCLPAQAYLMFGDPAHLDMFCELYASTMRYLQVGGGRAES
jgi:hypothetical protein